VSYPEWAVQAPHNSRNKQAPRQMQARSDPGTMRWKPLDDNPGAYGQSEIAEVLIGSTYHLPNTT